MPKVELLDERMQIAAAAEERRERRPSSPYVVGGANDAAERAADAVADRGMAMLRRAESARFAPAASGGESRIRRSTAAATVGRAGGPVDASFDSDLDAAMRGGRPIDAGTQGQVRRAIGHDVGDVRIHTDANADRLAQRIQASAFTVNRNIFFAAGQYRPDTESGMHTLLHESGHLLEDRGGVRRRAVRRKISKDVFDLDMEFPQKGGPAAGLRRALTPSGDIAKLRDALKAYHAGANKPPTDKKQAAALQNVIKYADEWLRKHPQVTSPEQRRRLEVVDTIRTEASMEFAKSQAAAIYMGDASKRIEQKEAAQSKGVVTVPKSGPGANPLQHLSHTAAFENKSLYEKRASLTAGSNGGKATTRRDAHVARGELAPQDAATQQAMTDALTSLSPAEFAAVHTYTGKDYEYINPNVGGWGVKDRGQSSWGAFDQETARYGGPGPDAAQRSNRAAYEEAGLHAGFMAQAMRKLPVWKGTTYKGLTMDADYLGLTTKSMYQANDYWSTSESKSQSVNFLSISAGTNRSQGKKVTKAVFCTVSVTNGRDVSRLSDAPQELEILLPPGSRMRIGKRQCFLRGKDDSAIRQHFGPTILDDFESITEFWLVDVTQQFSADQDVAGAYVAAGNTTPWAVGATSGAGAPMAGGGGSRFNRPPGR